MGEVHERVDTGPFGSVKTSLITGIVREMLAPLGNVEMLECDAQSGGHEICTPQTPGAHYGKG